MIRASIISLTLFLSAAAVTIPKLSDAFWAQKFQDILPPAKQNEVITRITTDQTTQQQLKTLQDFAKKLGNKDIKQKYLAVVKEAKQYIQVLEAMNQQMISEFDQQISDEQISDYLQDSYKSLGSLTQAIPKTVLMVSRNVAEKQGKEKTLEQLKGLITWEKEHIDDVASLNKFFAENAKE